MRFFKSFIRKHTTIGFRQSIHKCIYEYRILRIHRRNLKRGRSYYHPQGLKLHLGCGRRIKAGWVNIDLFSPSADLHLDLRESFPFSSGSVDIIYSEHFFEHLAYPDEVEKFLCDCLRVLKPGGLFSAGVPDAGLWLHNYVKKDEKMFRDARERFHPKWCKTWMHQINYLFRQKDEHKYAYDYETIAQVLGDAGFANVKRRPWDSERDSPGWERALYIDAEKPRLSQP